MTNEEKLKVAIEALQSIATDVKGKPLEMPHSCAEDWDSDYYSASGGNFDDAAEIGRAEGFWYAAETAQTALAKIADGEGGNG